MFFNGGPGAATSAYLFSFNTAPWTLDPAVAGSQPIVADPTSWAAFANLLYIDAPGTGFSYPLALANGTQPSVGIDLDRDAADVIRVVVRFLDRHPALQSGPVIVVGESYGGTRSALMLDRLLNYQELATTGAVYQDGGLQADLLSHFAAIYPGTSPATVSPAQIATQFGHQVLIGPVVTGSSQWSINTPDTSVCVANYEPYQCDQPNGWYAQVATAASNNLVTLATMKQALGVDPTTIAWMYASARTQAYGRNPASGIAAPDWWPCSGTLDADDTYFMLLNQQVTTGYSSTSRYWMDPTIGVSFLDDVAYVDTFITDARLDMVVWAPSIPAASFHGLPDDRLGDNRRHDAPGGVQPCRMDRASPISLARVAPTSAHARDPFPVLRWWRAQRQHGRTRSAARRRHAVVRRDPDGLRRRPCRPRRQGSGRRSGPAAVPAATTPQPRPFLGP